MIVNFTGIDKKQFENRPIILLGVWTIMLAILDILLIVNPLFWGIAVLTVLFIMHQCVVIGRCKLKYNSQTQSNNGIAFAGAALTIFCFVIFAGCIIAAFLGYDLATLQDTISEFTSKSIFIKTTWLYIIAAVLVLDEYFIMRKITINENLVQSDVIINLERLSLSPEVFILKNRQFIHRVNSLQQYRSYDSLKELKQFVKNQSDKYSEFEKRAELLREYQNRTRNIFKNGSVYNGLPIWEPAYRKAEDTLAKLICTVVSDNPCVIVETSYRSPAGRSHYSRKDTYDTNKILECTRTLFMLQQETFSPEDFLKNKADIASYPGVYILTNIKTGEQYVGQSTDVSGRLNQHFSGKGNQDVYADWKYGASFSIKTMPLAGSGFADLNAMEKYYIEACDSYENGYNKTSGNKSVAQ